MKLYVDVSWLMRCLHYATFYAMVVVASPSVDAKQVLTHHFDNGRTGWNNEEVILTPDVISKGQVGLLYSIGADIIDEQIDAQPLVMDNIEVNGQLTTVVFIVTEANTLYAVDAVQGKVVSKRNFGEPLPANAICGNGSDHLGINSTPVIDADKKVLYLIAAVWSGSSFSYWLHAVDLATLSSGVNPLSDKVAPTEIKASGSLANGFSYAFNPAVARQRAALLLSHDVVYAGFGSFCDQRVDETRGWILGWHADTLNPISSILVDHRAVSVFGSGRLGGIWMSGAGPASDDSGNIYVITGNSKIPSKFEADWDSGKLKPDPRVYLPDSAIELDKQLQITSWFTPSDDHFGYKVMDETDLDFGSGGAVLIPPSDVGSDRDGLAVAAGKLGQMYLLRQAALGGFDSAGVNHNLDVKDIGTCFCEPSFFRSAGQGDIVVSSGNAGLMLWKVDRDKVPAQLTLLLHSDEPMGTDYFQGGFFTSVSSNGVEPNTAVVWAIRRPQKADEPQNLTLHAFDATSAAHLCEWDAGGWPMNRKNGAAPNAIPVVAGGRIFVGAYRELRVYGVGGKRGCDQRHELAKVGEPREDALSYAAVDGEVIVRGSIVGVESNILHVQSEKKNFDIDMSEVYSTGRYGYLNVGKRVMIRGVFLQNGVLHAKSVFSGN